jgi:predicted nucleic acid-binding Zn ribbon protein
MCEIDMKAKKTKDGKIYVSTKCLISGKPITVTSRYGMFCEDLCQLEENKQAEKKCKAMIKSFNKLFGE